jgi:hypothetical protein
MMYPKKIKYWRYFDKDILSETRGNAIQLEAFLKWVGINRAHLGSMEIIDLQKYRLVKQNNKIAALLRLAPAEQMFLFPVHLN